jgi:hypothetical protein
MLKYSSDIGDKCLTRFNLKLEIPCPAIESRPPQTSVSESLQAAIAAKTVGERWPLIREI